ncbi:hypothetical protein KR49_00230 [Synechococcus sp. KORDI-49]|uniref:hypothetical protein n=1 Tax=Synechococcus sp. KORDI-49 TaxID=585423 RepID=UPI0004E05C54|nr:hypothetical protein [Synechococcus sp. KORDI-49]AII44896.1 hypothetical protein KR49_00230 [Synechococcus sp. KORDI-49]
MVTLSTPAFAPPENLASRSMERLALREQATESLRNNGWRLLYTGLTPLRASVTLLDPSESLQISLQIPLTDDVEDWDLWIEACNRQLSVPLRQWLEEQGVEQSTLSRMSGSSNGTAEPLRLSNMLQVARWLQGPIDQIEQLAEQNQCQVVLHLAGLGPNS